MQNEIDQMVQDTDEQTKLVPVTESIRYRKRAQSAEKQLAELTEQLNQAITENENLNSAIGRIETRQQLASQLSQAGSIDVETAMLLVEKRMEGTDQSEVSVIIDELKKQKPYLFENSHPQEPNKLSAKTAGVKAAVSSGSEHLVRQGRQAARSGSRTDMMRYLAARRNLN